MPRTKIPNSFLHSTPSPEDRPSMRIDLQGEDLRILDLVAVNEEVTLLIRGKVKGMQNFSGKNVGIAGELTLENISAEMITPNEFERLVEEEEDSDD